MRRCEKCEGIGRVPDKHDLRVALAGLGVRESARRMHLSAAYVSDMLKGHRAVSHAMLRRAGKAFRALRGGES